MYGKRGGRTHRTVGGRRPSRMIRDGGSHLTHIHGAVEESGSEVLLYSAMPRGYQSEKVRSC